MARSPVSLLPGLRLCGGWGWCLGLWQVQVVGVWGCGNACHTLGVS